MTTSGFPPSSREPLRSIVVVGGGTAGWMAATLLATKLAPLGVEITLVESTAIATVGVGEATTPAIRDFLAAAEVGEADVMRAAHGTIKLGIRFEGWSSEGDAFFHPFGLHGTPSGGVAFHHHWLRRRASGDRTPIEDYSLCSRLAVAGRFMAPPRPPEADWNFFDWAIHFDAGLFAGLLKRIAISRGVRHVDARVHGARRDRTSGLVTGILTKEAGELHGDLFIDCTGFRALLMHDALQVPYLDWSALLPCDRAVAVPSSLKGRSDPFTRAAAEAAGWRWRIPLRHRTGNGYVYSSTHVSDDEAVSLLLSRIDGDPLADPNFIRFRAGRRARFWEGNCVALGLAAGFLEPLESTSITLIHSALERLLRLLPHRMIDPSLRDEFNRVTALEYERIRDFLILHYWGNARHGEPFWDAMRHLALPPMLARKVDTFRARGELIRYEWESFQDPSWIAIYAGLGILPERWHPLADLLPNDRLASALSRIRASIDAIVARAPTHLDFLRMNLGDASNGSD